MRVRHLQSHLAAEQLIHAGNLESLRGFRVGIDAVYWLRCIQALKDPFADAIGGVLPGIFGFVDKELELFRRCGITPIFVFEGMVPGPQHSMFASRMNQQVELAWTHLAHGHKAEAQKCFAVSTSRINCDVVHLIFHHLRHRGCEVIQAPYFAGAQLSHFAEHSVVHSVFGLPGLLLYNIPRVVTHIDFHHATFDWVDLESVLTKWRLSKDQLVDACMLAGMEYCLTYPYLNLGHFQATSNVRFNFEAAVYTIKQAPFINWMQTFPTQAMMNEHVDGYCMCKVLVQSSPVLHLREYEVRPLGATLPNTPPMQVPHDFNKIFGKQLPGVLYYLIMHGILSQKLPQVLARGEWTDSSQPFVDTKEFRDLLVDLTGYRETCLGLIASQLHPSFSEKDIVCKAAWETSSPQKRLGTGEDSAQQRYADAPQRFLRPKVAERRLSWRIDATAIRREMERQGVNRVGFRFCLHWHAHEFRIEGPLYKDLTSGAPVSMSPDTDCLAALVHFMLLEHMELIADDGGMTVLGNMLKDVPAQFQEPCLVALELMKFGMLSGEPFDAAPNQPFPMEVQYPVSSEAALLLSRVMSLVPMRLNTDNWNADVDFDLAAFHSLVRVLNRSLRLLTESSLASVLLQDMNRVKLLPKGFHCASPCAHDPSQCAAIVPTFMLPRACMGIVTLFFLNYRGNDPVAFEQDLVARFPCCVNPLEDLRGAFTFWQELRRCVDEIAEPLGAEWLAHDMVAASEVLRAKQQQLGLLLPRGGQQMLQQQHHHQQQPQQQQHQQQQQHGGDPRPGGGRGGGSEHGSGGRGRGRGGGRRH